MKVSDIIAHAPPAGGGAQVFFGGGLVVLLAAVSSLAGLVFGLAGLVLALTHPGGRPFWPALGLALNGLPLLGAIFLWLY